jgi:hypothetical protein
MGNQEAGRKHNLKKGHLDATVVTALISTPQASMWKGSGSNKNVRNRTDYSIEKTSNGEQTGLKLQPAFVEWMMGFPLGWTDVERKETPETHASKPSGTP